MEYTVDVETYRFKSLELAFGNPSGTRAQMEAYCQQLQPGDPCGLWHAPRHPTRALCHRPGPLKPLMLLVTGGSWLAKLQLTGGLHPWTLPAAIGVWLLVHAVTTALSRYFVEALDTIPLARRRVEVCPTPEQVQIDRNFFDRAEAELSDLGLAKKYYLYAPLIRQVRHVNLDAVFVANDHRTMVIAGEIRFVGRLLGIVPLPFLKMQGIYFHSLMSNGVLIETLRGTESPDTPGKVHEYLPTASSMAEMLQAHEQRVRDYEQAEDAEPLPFSSVQDCIRSYLHDLHASDISGSICCEVELAGEQTAQA